VAAVAKHAIVSVAAFAVALGLMACGGGETSSATSAAAPTEATAAPTRGAVSPRSRSFRGATGPLKHLPEYGAEASGVERAAAQAVLEAYLHAVGKEEWGRACPYVSAQLRAQVTEIAKENRRPAAGCGRALRWYAGLAVGSTAGFESFGAIKVASLRVEGESGFALIHGPEGVGYWVAMKREGGGWKLYTLLPQPLG
jgi:hypothetical protein